MNKYEQQKIKTFKPWVGENYHKNDTRLLIVAESNYGGWDWEKYGEDINIFIIKERAEGNHAQAFHTNIYNLVSKFLNADSKKDFWHKVAFTNYLQVILANADERDVSHFFIHDDAFKKHFLSQIKELKPTHILVFSSRIGRLIEYNGAMDEARLLGVKKVQTTNHPSILRNKEKMLEDVATLFEN